MLFFTGISLPPTSANLGIGTKVFILNKSQRSLTTSFALKSSPQTFQSSKTWLPFPVTSLVILWWTEIMTLILTINFPHRPKIRTHKIIPTEIQFAIRKGQITSLKCCLHPKISSLPCHWRNIASSPLRNSIFFEVSNPTVFRLGFSGRTWWILNFCMSL